MPKATQRLRALRAASRLGARLGLPLLALWLGLGWALSRLTTRVMDWFVMTDELLYERLGISVAHLHSPLPRVHGELIPNLNQLYPVLLGAVYWHGDVPGSLRAAHLLNAFVMSSAAIPAYLLARRVTGSRALAHLVAFLTVCVPWIVYASFLLTEVAGYPAFLWAMLAIVATVAAPSRRRDALAIGGLALAVLARTQFIVLVPVVPVVLAAYELAESSPGRPAARLAGAIRRTFRRHGLLGWFYALAAAGIVVLLSVGRAGSVLGTYAGTIEGNLLPNGVGRALLEHVAALALPLGILPFVVGGAWLLAGIARPAATERYAFALTATITIVAVLLEVTLFDLRFGAGLVRDRYLFYLVPLLLVAFASALGDRSWPRWSLLLPAGLAGAGLLVARLPVHGGLNADAPASDLGRYVVTGLHSVTAARATLGASALVLTLLFVQGAALLSHRRLAGVLALLALVAFPAETAYAFKRLFEAPATSGRPLTLQQGNVFDWVDRAVGTGASVTMVPYPFIDGDYWASIAYWWDLEFWNASVDRAAYASGAFEGTPSTFPKLALRFDRRTGRANIAPTRYVAELASESRFRIDGDTLTFDRGARLIDTGGSAWYADWITLGLYDDGWTRPGPPATVRVFPSRGQQGPRLRMLVLRIRSPVDGRPVAVTSNAGRWRGNVSASQGTTVATVPVCQPSRGFTDIRISAHGQTPIHGDMRNYDTFGGLYRTAGVLLDEIDLEGIGKSCKP